MTYKNKHRDVYQEVTNAIIASIEAGTAPWLRPWKLNQGDGIDPISAGLPIRENGQAYHGINTLVLWAAGADSGYRSQRWLTYNAAKAHGGQVRRGEKSPATIVYFSRVIGTRESTDGTQEDYSYPLLKHHAVFNAQQCDGLKDDYMFPQPRQFETPEARIEHAEEFFSATGATIHHGGDKAYYTPSRDSIQMPIFNAFKDSDAYYATLAHETTHWTRHATRLNRSFGKTKFGDEGYAREELVAEIGSAFVCATLGLSLEPREDHAKYIAAWLKVLKEDKKAIFQAASFASAAHQFLCAFSDKDTDTVTGESEEENKPAIAA